MWDSELHEWQTLSLCLTKI